MQNPVKLRPDKMIAAPGLCTRLIVEVSVGHFGFLLKTWGKPLALLLCRYAHGPDGLADAAGAHKEQQQNKGEHERCADKFLHWEAI